MVHADYTLAAVEAFASYLGPRLREEGKQFCFVYVSGALTVRDQDTSLWFMAAMRKTRGALEVTLEEFEREREGEWKLCIARPGYVTKGEPRMGFAMNGWYIPQEELAAALVDVAVSGDRQGVLENVDLRQRGKAALETVK